MLDHLRLWTPEKSSSDLARIPMKTDCNPRIARVTPSSIQCREKVIPTVMGPIDKGSVRSSPKANNTIPGLNKKNAAPCTKNAFRLIHPAYQLLSGLPRL